MTLIERVTLPEGQTKIIVQFQVAVGGVTVTTSHLNAAVSWKLEVFDWSQTDRTQRRAPVYVTEGAATDHVTVPATDQDIFSDTFRTELGWDKDDQGYNFLFVLDEVVLQAASPEFSFRPGGKIRSVFKLQPDLAVDNFGTIPLIHETTFASL